MLKQSEFARNAQKSSGVEIDCRSLGLTRKFCVSNVNTYCSPRLSEEREHVKKTNV